jgi:hypothetical protein
MLILLFHWAEYIHYFIGLWMPTLMLLIIWLLHISHAQLLSENEILMSRPFEIARKHFDDANKNDEI